ncbi:tripartite tricarboxylate transporter permease [Pseudogracilibacillus sp. SO30301A]|uniref:tripartite tricarboxylate transporter permease n=1 Tax=Pseudogracilibacillus sp. SO30301A TaxID=3098291 RepID=UPI00300E6C66
MDVLLNFLMPILNLELLLMVALGTFAGIYVGAIPGLSVTMAVALLLSLTYSWDLLPALALIIGIYTGGVYGGSRAAILLNIPGGPSAVATTFDGYPIAQRGEAGQAMGLATITSVIGGMVGVVFLAFTTPVVSQLALHFAHRDYFLLAFMGLLLVGSLSKGSFIKSVFAAFLGIIIGLVGLDNITAVPRLTFGMLDLQRGFNIIVVILGLFGFSEVLYQMSKSFSVTVTNKVGKIVPTLAFIIKFLPLSLQSSLIGVLSGVLPGVGGEIAALFSYDRAKKTVKKPTRPFGEGAYEGVVAPETANSAAIGGALIPMLTLGIPGDAVTAVIIGAFVIHGLNPGPLLMIDSPDMFWVITGSLFLSNIFLLIFGFMGIKAFQKIVTIPKGILLPIITVLTVIGAYSINNSITDIYWMIAFGFVGYFFRIFGFSVAPLVLGVILGPLIDKSLRASLIASQHNFGDFLLGFVTSPISLVLFLITTLAVLSGTSPYKKVKSFIGRKVKLIFNR